MKKLITFTLPLVSVLLLIIAGEVVIRVFHYLRWGISIIDGQPKNVGGLSAITLDPQLGWRATENYRFEGKINNSDGTTYAVQVSQDADGFRLFGNVSSGKPRVFVIGDSFTQATAASDDKTFFAVIKRLLDVEVFAYGGGGYGSLQEYMILDKYIDVIKPDLIIWQFCTNDFINNSAELETASKINNNGMVRPYWANHKVSYILPKEDVRDLRLFALKYCRICYLVLNRVDRLAAAKPTQTVETETSTGRSAHTAFLNSVKVTEEIMKMAKKRAGSVPIVAFLAGTGSPYGPEYEQAVKEISNQEHIILFDDIDDSVRASEKNGAVATVDGAHLNELGHRVAGEAIIEDLKKACLLNLCSRVKKSPTTRSLNPHDHRIL